MKVPSNDAVAGQSTADSTQGRSVPPGQPSTDGEFRVEHDSMGEVQVPAWAKWRAQTQRAVENFPVSGQRLERAHIEALARVKKAGLKIGL